MKNGKATYTVDFSSYENGKDGEIDLSKINYMRVFFAHTFISDEINMKISNVKIVDSTNICTVPSIFSDGMMLQQNKDIQFGVQQNLVTRLLLRFQKQMAQL